MRISGSLWIWRDPTAEDPNSSRLSFRPTPRKQWHWLALFSPSLGVLLLLLLQFLPVPFAHRLIALSWIAFPLACFALGFWWRRKWVGDRFGHGIMAGLAVLALNIGVPLLLVALVAVLWSMIAPK